MPADLSYRLGVWAYRLGFALAAPFSEKASKRVRGAGETLELLHPTAVDQDCYWMHCASVGEFEQGRPLWQELMSRKPSARFVLSFFSSSGYEHFRQREGLGEVVYLPWDTGSSAHEFVERLSPKLAIFIKYEWWLGFHLALKQLDKPAILVSAAFRPKQAFFRSKIPAAASHREALSGLRRVYVQDQGSVELLSQHGYQAPLLVGDTRLDRTLSIRDEEFRNPIIEHWKNGLAMPLLIAGSTWGRDEDLLTTALKRSEKPFALLCVPHEIGGEHLAKTGRLCQGLSYAFYSELENLSTEELEVRLQGLRVIVLDAIGMLSRLYRYADLAYVGGGFGAGIHNTLEPGVYGIPIAFGPRYRRFLEARALVERGIAHRITGPDDLLQFVDRFSQPEERKEVLAKAGQYISDNQGATGRIVEDLLEQGLL